MELVGELAKQGILALLLGIMIYAFYRKDKALEESYSARISDTNKLAIIIEATNAASKALEVTSENRSRVIESVGESTKATALAISALSNNVDKVSSSTEKANMAIALLREDFDVLERDRTAEYAMLEKRILAAIAKVRRPVRSSKG